MVCAICNHFRPGQRAREHASEFTWQDLRVSARTCYCCGILVSGCGRCFQQHKLVEDDVLQASLRFYYPPSDDSSWEWDASKDIIFSLKDGRRFQVEMFAIEDDDCPVPDSWGVMPTFQRVSPRSDSAAAMAVIRSWISECVNEHELCERPPHPDLPTRVVDVGLDDGVVRLVETHGAKGDYLCLSHCWGLAQIITTTTSTIASRKAAVSWEDLSNTFRDAITFTRSLGFRYIWIDSLCIIQDDAHDWAVESSKMAAVYSNGHLTLAGTHSANGHGGLFGPTADIEITGQTPGGEEYCVFFRERIDHHLEQCDDELGKTMQLSNPTKLYYPLLTRAWVYQERMLSARVVHFGHYEAFFECRSGIDCECSGIAYGGSTNAASMVQMKVEHSHALGNLSEDEDEEAKYRCAQLWRTMVATYTSLRLTKSEDRLPAIGGLARDMAVSRKSRYLAGLWSDTLNDDLLWIVTAVSTKKPRVSPPIAPSWSWAGAGSLVQYWDDIVFTPIEDYDMRPERPPFEHFVKVDHCQVTSSTVDEFGSVGHGELRLTGLVASGALEHEIEVHGGVKVTATYFVGEHVRLPVAMDNAVGCVIPGHEVVLTNAYCLRMSRVVDGLTDRLISLILVDSPAVSGTFERVGALVIKASSPPVESVPSLFRGAKEMTVTVV
ncbi:unnamed protein product [Discula destructiva]